MGSLLVNISTTKILDVTNRTPPLRYTDSLQHKNSQIRLSFLFQRNLCPTREIALKCYFVFFISYMCISRVQRMLVLSMPFQHAEASIYQPQKSFSNYKILLFTFKCIYGQVPTYLSDLISIKSNSLYNLKSTGKLLLDHPKGKMLTTLGARSFSAAAPKLWNELPVELHQATSLDSFKSRLKTYFLRSIFYSL